MEDLDLFSTFNKSIDFKYLKIDIDKIKEFVNTTTSNDCKIPSWQEEAFLINQSEDDFNFIFLINSINFSYWSDLSEPKWNFIYNGKKYTGSFALFSAFKKAIENNYPLFDPNYLKNMSKEDLSLILEKYEKIPMFRQRLKVLKDIGNNLSNSGYKSFYQIYKDSNNSAINLIDKIINIFPSFNDSFIYKDNKYNFFKRVQLIPAMIYGRNLAETKIFDDIDKLTVFADYRVPQTLRKLGIVEYFDDLSNDIKYKTYLKEGSEKELEIRISTIQACNILKSFLNSDINSLNIDYYMWKKGKTIIEPDYDFHRTRTIFY